MGAQGSVTLDFGAFPGQPMASIAVTGQTGIGTGSLVEVWIAPLDTSDHTAEEHIVDPPQVSAGPPVAGAGFTIYGLTTPNLVPLQDRPAIGQVGNVGSLMIWGKWNVAWVWN